MPQLLGSHCVVIARAAISAWQSKPEAHPLKGAARVHDYKKMNISHQLAWNLTDQAHSAAGEFSVSGVGSSDILGAARLAAREVSQSGVGSDLYGAARAAALEAGETCLKDLTTREASIMARFGN